MSKFNISDEVLLQYLNGELEGEDRLNLEQWLEQESNRHYLEELRAVWQLTALEAPMTDIEQAWLRIKQRAPQMQPARRVLFSPAVITRIAAGLLLVIGGWAAIQFLNDRDEAAPAAVAATNTPAVNDAKTTIEEQLAPAEVAPSVQTEREAPSGNKHSTKVITSGARPEKRPAIATLKSGAAKEEICNSTMCPLEICIVQSLECEGGKPSIFAQCSMLRPDESGTLHYKLYNEQNSSCKAPVQEVRITRMNTGETIVLTETSAPLTAQDFFDYITGSKKGDVTAGIFEADCDNQRIDELIRLDNRMGMPVIQ